MGRSNLAFLLFTVVTTCANAAEREPHFPLTDTGQATCFDLSNEMPCPSASEAYFGQDAQHKGVAQSFTDIRNGTVKDNVTGLLWQQTPSKKRMSWSAAQAYCEALTLAGRQDWRAPNLKELFGISDFSEGWPYLDGSVFFLAGTGKDQQFWASNFYKVGTTHGGAPSAFGVNHSTGHIKAYPADPPKGGPKANGGRPKRGAPPPPRNGEKRPARPEFGKLVRCVAGDEIGKNNYTDNDDGTITDASTGLMWSQADAGEDMDWPSALAHAEDMNAASYLGYSDWRLPNIRELQSIVDYSGVFPAIDHAYFRWTESDRYYWSSTSAYFNKDAPEHYYAWYVAFGFAPGPDGKDVHGAGAVRFVGKSEKSPHSEGDYRPFNAVRLVRDAN